MVKKLPRVEKKFEIFLKKLKNNLGRRREQENGW